ncbi:MAG: HAMP domain-containing histidine kinase [Lachnospiraceae bacterium]|nr:HAMP domain-containing histidine kinase [Lachnospiraceae bacterium]
MNGKLYWKQKLPIVLLNFLCMIGLVIFLHVTGNSFDSIVLICLIWIVILTAHLVMAYYSRKTQMEKLLKLAEQLEERYLLSEVMEKPERADDQVYYRLLKLAGKSMLEQVAEVRRERTQYREYVEQWVHEIKTPITAMKLLCENVHLPETKELLVELEKINCFTEQALYYARSEHTEKDYSVREIRLFDVIHQSIAENKYLLLQNGVGIDLQETDDIVYSDEKWLCFILNQLIVNSVKYRTKQPVLKFYTEYQGNQIILCVQDNGIGIDAGDLPRIFEKGFTGQNGRKVAHSSTGIGLYLCKRLCDKLGIGICADSNGSGTVVRLSFHINDFIQRVQD